MMWVEFNIILIRNNVFRHPYAQSSGVCLFHWKSQQYYKKPADGRHWISRPMRILEPIPKKVFLLVQKYFLEGVKNLFLGGMSLLLFFLSISFLIRSGPKKNLGGGSRVFFYLNLIFFIYLFIFSVVQFLFMEGIQIFFRGEGEG